MLVVLKVKALMSCLEFVLADIYSQEVLKSVLPKSGEAEMRDDSIFLSFFREEVYIFCCLL